MNEQTKLIKELVLSNGKLTATLALYNKYHLTKEEKQRAAETIDLAQDESGIKKAAENLSKILDSAYQFSDEDSTWSPGFIRELLKYHENQSGYNPLHRLRGPFSIVKGYFELMANEETLDEQSKIDLQQIKEALPAAMSEITQVYMDLEGDNEDSES